VAWSRRDRRKWKPKAGRVKVSYLPGYGPTGAGPPQLTRFPFRATINGRGAIVSRSAYGIEIDYPTERSDDGSEGLRL